jgi:hypothetical protein
LIEKLGGLKESRVVTDVGERVEWVFFGKRNFNGIALKVTEGASTMLAERELTKVTQRTFTMCAGRD